LVELLIPKICRPGNQISLAAVPTLTIDALGGVDNVALDLTIAAFKSRRVCLWFYETHLPAIQTNAQTPAWFSCPHENESGPRNFGTPPTARP
jgi:hypothetical protein